MLRNKITTIAVSLAAALSFGGVALVPSAAQAQWHNICIGGHCITHTNYTIGGESPCARIGSNYGKAYEGLLEALQNEKEQVDKVHPEMTPKEAQEQVEDAEAAVHAADLAAFEWGCSVATPSRTVPPVIKGQFTTTLGHLQLVAFNQVYAKQQSTKVSTAKASAAKVSAR
jgi:hypothetical protein